MRIGVVTFWSSLDNYGQILQGYALQSYLKKIGEEPFIIRYEQSKVYPNIFVERSLRSLILRLIKSTLHHKSYNQQLQCYRLNQLRDFNHFKGGISYSDRVYRSYKELRDSPPQADIYIVGSDQVWGRDPKSEEEKPYYLMFGDRKTKRIAYAASLGNSIHFEKNPQLFKERYSLFEAISLREYSRVEQFKAEGIDVNWVLDPVALLDRDDYYRIIGSYRNRERGSIYLYTVNIGSSSEIEFSSLQDFAIKRELSIIATPSSGYIPFTECFEGVTYDYPTIEGWLSNIAEASYVATTSFHGVMFALILHKEFAYIPLKSDFSRGNDRVVSLLRELNLENRVVKDNYEAVFNNSINWVEVDDRLSELIDASKEFLLDAIKGQKEDEQKD